MPEEDWEEVSQGIPSKEDSFIQKYIAGQQQLIEQEKKQRSGTSPPPPLPSLLRVFRLQLPPIPLTTC
jgi:hypothetical protein